MKKKTFTLIMGLLLTALGAAAQNSGTTGPLTWNYNAGTKTLSVTGTGAMPDYTEESDQPWHALRDEIKTVTIGNGVTTVGNIAFTGCRKLQSVTLPATLTEIKSNGFSYCTALESITLPASLTKIRSAAFTECPALTAFKVDPGNAHFSVADGVLYNKAKTRLLYYPAGKAATSFSVPAGVSDIGNLSFFQATKLQSITLPTGLKTIEVQAFGCCTALKSIRIPSAVSSIGDSAFDRCKALTEVIVGWDTPLAIDADVFDNVTLSGVTLKVPKGTKAKYQAAPVWKDFKINETTANQTVDGLRVFAAAGALRLTLPKAETVHIYHVNGALVKTLALSAGDHVQPLPSGVYLVRVGERVTKILVK